MDIIGKANDTISSTVQDAVGEHFSGLTISEIQTNEGLDHDGDEVWFIRIILEAAEMDRLDTKRTTSLARILRSKLREAGSGGFPIISYIDRAELKGANAEAG